MQLDIALWTECVASVNDVRGGLVFFPCVRGFGAGFGTCRRRARRVEERRAAFTAEEVEFVVEPLTKGGVVDGNVTLFDDRCGAVMTPPTELLEQESARRIHRLHHVAHFEIIHVAIRLSLMLVSTDVLQPHLTGRTSQTVGVPTGTSGVDH